MPDVIDVILGRLSVSTLESLDEINLNSKRQSQFYSEELEKSLDSVESVYLNRCSLEVNDKTELFISKMRKNKILFDKYMNQFKRVNAVFMSNGNLKDVKPYNQQLEILQERLSELTKGMEGNLEPEQMFINIYDMYKKIEDFEMKINNVKERLHCYEKFPANIAEAQYFVADVKNRIKRKEAILESKLN